MERMNFEEMKRAYPDEWLIIGEIEENEVNELISGVVLAHHPRRGDIHKRLLEMEKGAYAVLFSGEIAAPDEVYML